LRTFTPKPADINRAWHVIDAEGQVLGKVATEAANLLRGKHKPIWAPHVDTGDHVVIVNAAKLDLSARKLADKRYHRHSGYPGGLSSESLERLLGRPLVRKHSPTRVGDVPHTLADISAAKRDMGYEPIVDFAEGLRRTVAYFTEGTR